jgi:AAA+ ATPase superfamily predicted ATPase
VGRKRELRTLEDVFQSNDSSFIPIYGRRRVGKSELIKHFIKDKNALYFLGKQAPARLQLREFLRNAALTFHQPLLEQVSVDGWRQAISIVIEQVSADEKLVLVMDEFQWTVEACPELPSVLQSFIDNGWEGGCKVCLILCGSYMGFMERKVLGEKSPLFGRRAGQIFLKPFSYLEAGKFHPTWSETDKAKVFSICGGIPYYLNFFSRTDSIDANIRNNFLNEFSALAREPEFLLREELKELKKYFGILTALSTGAVTNREMARITGIDERALFYYLNTLIELGYIIKHYPLTGTKANPKQVRYKLHDPLLCFWFRFVYPNGSAIYQMDEKSAFLNLIKPHLDAYFGKGYETLCKEALSHLYQREELTCAYEIGEYWDKDIQIDIVGYRQDGVIDICECKWGKISSMPRLLKELNTKISCYPNKDNKTIHGRLFLRSKGKGLSNHSIRAHFLSDLYRLE